MIDRGVSPGVPVRTHLPLVPLTMVGLYAWLVAVTSGATLLDMVYAAETHGADGGTSALLVGEAADFLLTLAALTLLAGLPAVAAAWPWPTARALLVSSVGVLAIMLVAGPMLSPLAAWVEETSGLVIGPWLRLGTVAVASITALGGLAQLARRR